MKSLIAILTAFLSLLACLSACPEAGALPAEEPIISGEAANDEQKEKGETMIYARIGDRTITIRPEDNSSAEAFTDLLRQGDITVDMRDYGGFEKVGPLGTTLPTNDESITTEPGDVILYMGSQITIYYDTNTWSFTRLGKVQDMTADELREALGAGDPTVVFSLSSD